jgi:hypothetical protein
MPGDNEKSCPVCDESLSGFETRLEETYFQCPRCGPYALGDLALAVFRSKYRTNRVACAKLSHSLYRMTQAPGRCTQMSRELLENILADPVQLPFPTEQLDNFITWLGSTQKDPGDWVEIHVRAIAAVGAIDLSGLGFIAAQATSYGLAEGSPKLSRVLSGASNYAFLPMQLTIEGWRRFEDLRQGRRDSRMAFMAMPFGFAELDSLFTHHFVPAVAMTGFQLKRLDESQPAGLIDDRMRVEIRQATFLVSDLTHGNPGAYWEAGYAEGLGKPVIYTCRKDVFENETTNPHFDTNHHLTVIWDPSNLDQALIKLKATIRATFPVQAVLAD